MTQNEVDVVNEILNGLFSEYYWLFRKNHEYVKMLKIVENAIDKYSQNRQTQKAIECLKECEYYIIDLLAGNYDNTLGIICAYIDTKIKELEGEKE